MSPISASLELDIDGMDDRGSCGPQETSTLRVPGVSVIMLASKRDLRIGGHRQRIGDDAPGGCCSLWLHGEPGDPQRAEDQLPDEQQE